MTDRTSPYMIKTYEAWFDHHPEARAEMSTTTVRQQVQPGRPIVYLKNTARGEVTITAEEFAARYWAREHRRSAL